MNPRTIDGTHLDRHAARPLVQTLGCGSKQVQTPFGQENGNPTGSNLEKFTGKPLSQTTGLYYYGARWYDASIGRFISQDPYPGHRSDPQSLNRYVYAGNAPTTYTDPTGMLFGLDTLFGAAAGAVVGYAWCVGNGGGWTSSACGESALLGAGVGALAGTTDGISLLFGVGCEEECPGLIGPTSSDVTPTVTTDVTTGGAGDAVISATSSSSDLTGSTVTSVASEDTAIGMGETSPPEMGGQDMTTVRHYTSWEGRNGITSSGVINIGKESDFVYVTEPSQVQGLSTPQEIGTRLGLPAERAVT